MAVDDQYTVSLMHFDGNLNDESGKVWTAYGGATTSAAAAKFGSGGLYCPVASYSYLKGPSLTLGGQDFCIEGFASLGSASANFSRISDFGNGQQSDNIIISKTNSQAIQAYLIDGTTTVWDSPGATISYDTMFHYALSYVHSTGTWRFFVGGSLIATTTHTWNLRTTTLNYYGKSNWSIDGYPELKLDEPRISDGNARYTANFTPPTAPFGSQSLWLPQPIIFF